MAKNETKEIKSVETELKVYETELVSDKDRAEELVIKTDEEYTSATEFVGYLSGKAKDLEKLRKFFVDPLNKQVKDINAMFKPQVEQREQVVTIVKRKMLDFFNKKEEARLKEEKRLQDIRDKANEKRAEKGLEAIEEPVREVADVARTNTADTAQSTVKKVWVHKIVSINALPDDVKKAIFEEAYNKGIIDTIIRKFVNAGVREMSGVEIYQESQMSVKRG